MQDEIKYIDRVSKKEEKEQVYGGSLIDLFYGRGCLSRLASSLLLPIVSKVSFLSFLYGFFQKSRFSRRKVVPFIKSYQIDETEFQEPSSSFRSFNEFFIRKLKPACRPISGGNDVAVLPADGRYLVYPEIDKVDGFLIKGQKFKVEEFLKDETFCQKYADGSMVIARLCPTDYHRFHFPFNCVPQIPRLINGSLFSVNPIALKRNIHIFSENKRMITVLNTKPFGEVLYIEVGATCVGSIHQTFIPGEHYAKGDEKGYFSFGGSTLVLLFERGRIQFDQDLIDASSRKMEMKGLLGQSMGRALSIFL
jgi:phosphatidylserine decarboxylase